MLTHEVDQSLERNGIGAVPDVLINSSVRDRLCEVNGSVKKLINEFIQDGLTDFDARGIMEKHLLHLVRRLQAGIPLEALGAIYDGMGAYEPDKLRAMQNSDLVCNSLLSTERVDNMPSRKDYAIQASAMLDAIQRKPFSVLAVKNRKPAEEESVKSAEEGPVKSFRSLADALQAKSQTAESIDKTSNTNVIAPVHEEETAKIETTPVAPDKDEEFPINSKWTLKRGRVVFKISRVMDKYEKLEFVRDGTSKPTVIGFAEFREKYVRRE